VRPFLTATGKLKLFVDTFATVASSKDGHTMETVLCLIHSPATKQSLMVPSFGDSMRNRFLQPTAEPQSEILQHLCISTRPKGNHSLWPIEELPSDPFVQHKCISLHHLCNHLLKQTATSLVDHTAPQHYLLEIRQNGLVLWWSL
jgi:hypothetical protein